MGCNHSFWKSWTTLCTKWWDSDAAQSFEIIKAEVPLHVEIHNSEYFQHDGATPHFSLLARECLKKNAILWAPCYWTCLWPALATTLSRSVSGWFLFLGNSQGRFPTIIFHLIFKAWKKYTKRFKLLPSSHYLQLYIICLLDVNWLWRMISHTLSSFCS